MCPSLAVILFTRRLRWADSWQRGVSAEVLARTGRKDFCTYPAVAMRSLLPNSHSGILVLISKSFIDIGPADTHVNKAKIPISIPKIPNGSAGPADCTHPAAKKVQAKETTAREMVVMTKQSAEMER